MRPLPILPSMYAGLEQAERNRERAAAEFRLPKNAGPKNLQRMTELSRMKASERRGTVKLPKLSFLDHDEDK